VAFIGIIAWRKIGGSGFARPRGGKEWESLASDTGAARGRQRLGRGVRRWRWAAPGGTLKQRRERDADWWGRVAQYRSAWSNGFESNSNSFKDFQTISKTIQTVTNSKRTFLSSKI
jgi:hypothetical protein